MGGWNFTWDGNVNDVEPWDDFDNWTITNCPPFPDPCPADQYPDDSSDKALVRGSTGAEQVQVIELVTVTIAKLTVSPSPESSYSVRFESSDSGGNTLTCNRVIFYPKDGPVSVRVADKAQITTAQ